MSDPEVMQVIIRLPSLPTRPEPKVKGTRAASKLKRMDWSCASCKNMICLLDDFNLKQARQEERLSDMCPLTIDYFMISRAAFQNLLNINRAIKTVREGIWSLEKSLKDERIKEAGLVVDRHTRLKEHYQKVTITRIKESKSKRKKGKDAPLPTFKITVAEVKY